MQGQKANSSQLKKVVHFSSVHLWSDTRILKKECTSLAKNGYNVHFVCARGENASNDAVRIHLLKSASSRLGRMFFTAKQVYTYSRQLDADIYHFHDPELLPWALLLRLHNKKVIYDVHESVPGAIQSRAYLPSFSRKIIANCVGALEVCSAKRMSAIVCATQFISLRFTKKHSSTIIVNNYPFVEELNVGTEAPTIKKNAVLYVGDITYARGLMNIMDALALLPTVNFELAGNFSDRNIETDMKNHPAWKQTNYHGFINRKKYAELLNTCKVGLVLFLPGPNHLNAQPNKLFEYMSAGLPVVASNFELWREIIERPEAGICVDPENKLKIADAIKRVMEKDEIALKMGMNGKRCVIEKFNWEGEEKKLISLYNLLSE